MELAWVDLLLSAIGGSVISLAGSIVYFRPKLKQAKADADMKETEAQNFMYDSLLSRMNTMEKMYNEQNDIIAGLRKEILQLGEEKFSNEKRIVQLEAENRELRLKVDKLDKEVSAYKTIAGNK